MRFPLRLSAALFNSRIKNLFGSKEMSQPIFVFSPCATNQTPQFRCDERSPGLEWHSPKECVERLRAINSPVVWLSGAEPLLHPEIGDVTDALTENGRFVFLHTSGYGLRQCIHEFRPNSRLFLTVEFAGREEVHDRAVGRPGAFRRSIEAIRAAKLSGFLVAAHFPVGADSDPCEIGQLIESLDNKDVDGFIVSRGGRTMSNAGKADIEALADARALIRYGRWERFSQLLDDAYAEQQALQEPAGIRASGENAFEEGD